MRQISVHLKRRMAAEGQSLAEENTALLQLPWWRRYTRWKQTSLAEAEAAERTLLASCRSNIEITDVRIGPGQEERMHTIAAGNKSDPTLVLLPGYGAAAGFYFRNLDDLAKQFRVYMVDLLGTGLSGRPRWEAKTRVEAETFFVDSLQKWKKENGIKEMILVGHSLSGYLAATYAMKYPNDVKHVVLVCPAGMATAPVEAKMPEWAKNPWTFRGVLYRTGLFAWDKGGTPGVLIRGLGPYGPVWVNGYAKNRFQEGEGLKEEETAAFGHYIYHTMAQKGSGEFALRHLLAPFAYARHPLEGRLHELKVPCSLIYGESDWMKPENGKRVFADMESRRGKLTQADLQYDVIPNAGHYPFLDQPALFLQRMLKQMHPYLAGRGQDQAKIADQHLKEADQAAKEAIKLEAKTNSKRSFDL